MPANRLYYQSGAVRLQMRKGYSTGSGEELVAVGIQVLLNIFEAAK